MPNTPFWTRPDWWAALGTIAAVVVAIFGESAWTWWRRPRLELSIVVAPPDCVKTFFTGEEQGQRGPDCYFFRVLVENRGKRRAEDVEVYAQRLSRMVNGEFQTMREFPPMDLLWSHVKKPLQGVSPGLQKHCDLGFIRAPERSLEDKIDAMLTQNAMFYFDLEVKPNRPGWSIGAGTYRLDLAVAAANAAVRKLELEIEFLGQWFDSEEQMFRDGIRIKPVKPDGIRACFNRIFPPFKKRPHSGDSPA